MGALSSRSAGFLLAAALGFVLVAEVVRPHVPPPEGHGLEARLEHLARDAAGYDVVVLGASTVRRAFDPDAFDHELASRGYALRSFNLGLPGAAQLEIDYLIDVLLARAAVPPRYVVVELPTDRLDKLIPPVNHLTDRAIHWHAPRQTFDWFRAVAGSSELRLGGRAGLEALRHAAWRWTSLGQGDRIAARLFGLGAAEREAAVRVAARGRGYEPFVVGPEALPSDLRDQLLGQPEWYRGVVARIDLVNDRAPPWRGLEVGWLLGESERVRAAGGTLLHLTTPTIKQTAEIHALHRAGVISELFAFDSPSRYPEFYEPENRFDPIHLNDEGARLFSREFARRFAGWLEKTGG